MERRKRDASCHAEPCDTDGDEPSPGLGQGHPHISAYLSGGGEGGELSWDGGRKGASFVTVFRPCPLKL